MGQPLLNDNHLNQQQQDMLRLFKNPMPDEDYVQMRRLAVQLLSKQLDSKVEVWEDSSKKLMRVITDSNILLVAIGKNSRFRPVWTAFINGKFEIELT
jgi:hypothetical protein